MRRTHARFVWLCLLLPATPALAQEAKEEAQKQLLPGPGWRWELEPQKLRAGWEEHGWSQISQRGALSLIGLRNGRILAQWTQTDGVALQGVKALRFEVILVDREGGVVPRGTSSSMSNGEISLQKFLFHPKADTQMTRVGLAVLDFEGRKAAAEAARKDADALGAAVLPLPIVDEMFDFELPTMNGETLRASELRGKVILLDCWATW